MRFWWWITNLLAPKRIWLHLLPNTCLELMRHDATFRLYVETNQIYNLACPASPVQHQYDPVQTIKTGVHGAINMLGLAKRTRARILQASTSEVYGDPEVHPQPEEYWGRVNPIGIRSSLLRNPIFDIDRQHNLYIKVVCIFNTYGPRMHPNHGRVVSNFIVQTLKRQDITIVRNDFHNQTINRPQNLEPAHLCRTTECGRVVGFDIYRHGVGGRITGRVRGQPVRRTGDPRGRARYSAIGRTPKRMMRYI